MKGMGVRPPGTADPGAWPRWSQRQRRGCPSPSRCLFWPFQEQQRALTGVPNRLAPAAPVTAAWAWQSCPEKPRPGAKNPMGVWGTSARKFLTQSSESNCNVPRLNINGWTFLQGLPIHFPARALWLQGERTKQQLAELKQGPGQTPPLSAEEAAPPRPALHLTLEHVPVLGGTRCWSSSTHSSHGASALSHGTCAPAERVMDCATTHLRVRLLNQGVVLTAASGDDGRSYSLGE